jgi:hypothetical protein
MNALLKNLLFVLFTTIQVLHARTVEELQVAYEVKVLAIEKEYRESVATLKKGYLGALDGAQKKLQQGGRLDDVLLVQKEAKRVEAEQWPLPSLGKSSPTDLVRVRKLYETARVKTEKKRAESLVEITDKMIALLESETVTLTKAGKIAEAKAAKEKAEALSESPEIKAARALQKRVRLNQSAPIAKRIRRSGDDLEVLVRFDKSGRVSLDSPVENVVEITGGKKEKGDTKASVLGEFIGAKDYRVDPFVAYESKMAKIIPPMAAVNLELEPNFEFQERKSLRVMMGERAINPRVEWPDVLPPLKDASRIQLNFDYFIPKENKVLKGFQFHWGNSTVIGEETMSTSGKWVTKSLESESLNEWTTLRFRFDQMAEAKKVYNGGNESIYLANLKITYLGFSAHLVADYEDGKPVKAPITKPEAQKPMALSGKLLSAK